MQITGLTGKGNGLERVRISVVSRQEESIKNQISPKSR